MVSSDDDDDEDGDNNNNKIIILSQFIYRLFIAPIVITPLKFIYIWNLI